MSDEELAFTSNTNYSTPPYTKTSITDPAQGKEETVNMVSPDFFEEPEDEDQTKDFETIGNDYPSSSATSVHATTPNISEDSEDSAPADKIPQQQAPEVPDQVTVKQVPETNGPEDTAPDEQVPEYQVVEDQKGLEDRQSRLLKDEDFPDEHCAVFPNKTEDVFKNKEQPADEVMHDVKKHAKETIKDQKQSEEKVKAPKSPEIPTLSSINSSRKKIGPKNISDRFSSSKLNYALEFKCKLCQKKFRTPRDLKKHKHTAPEHERFRSRTKNREKDIPPECVTLNRNRFLQRNALVLPSALVHHTQGHLKEQRSGCAGCGHTTNNIESLPRHLRSHTEGKPFACAECGKRWISTSILRVHIRTIHLKEKRYSCKVRNYKTYQKTRMEEHATTHTGETKKPNECGKCSQVFGNKVQLSNHMVTDHKYKCCCSLSCLSGSCGGKPCQPRTRRGRD